ncbi:hypothetical protein DAERI_060123 [Deinococcus aerius]|uniref:HTH marR-type domain-containing protein n=1 Tax=Deinococcus aerius TaxID=200253 RepID=A0A2I9CVC0_9DEIO|nr:hypothetical protein [Deinococcus aerius]GBF05863.1 hypothetical protein DAERI_060123 [Deinococcus aerius]
MSGRTGLRRARVLLALTEEGQSATAIGRKLELHNQAAESILDALVLAGLAAVGPGRGRMLYSYRLATGPHVAQAQAEARALLEARGVGA